MSFGPNPWQQQSWDARAAANFMCGGAGCGLLVFTPLAGGPRWLLLAGAALVGLGLLSVFLEIGRPLRAANVLRHPGRSWMTREAMVAPLLFAVVAAAAFGASPAPWLSALVVLAALAFVYCQARMLQAAKGIPAWREPLTVPLIVATRLAEGGGLWLLLVSASAGPASLLPWLAFALILAARFALWLSWRRRLRAGRRTCRVRCTWTPSGPRWRSRPAPRRLRRRWTTPATPFNWRRPSRRSARSRCRSRIRNCWLVNQRPSRCE